MMLSFRRDEVPVATAGTGAGGLWLYRWHVTPHRDVARGLLLVNAWRSTLKTEHGDAFPEPLAAVQAFRVGSRELVYGSSATSVDLEGGVPAAAFDPRSPTNVPFELHTKRGEPFEVFLCGPEEWNAFRVGLRVLP